MKLFYQGRKNGLAELAEKRNPQDRIIWIQAASLGEYEQAVPIIQALKKSYPTHKILVSFYSPSGYEQKKADPLIDFSVYLPIDTPKNARRFMEIVQPELGLFIKYDIWPNFLGEAKKTGTPLLLISGVFREEQIYFRPYGQFMRNALARFDHLFVQEENSVNILKKHGFTNVSISGDTRYDRVFEQLSRDNDLGFAEEFIQKKTTLVCGSTWPEDESVIVEGIKNLPEDLKVIIAPHEIKLHKIEQLQKDLPVKSIRFSEREKVNLGQFKVLIVDTIGLLSQLYAYADIAYVGGAMGKTGLHNILEPAVFEVPVVIGKNFKKFPEAKALQREGGLFAVRSAQEFHDKLELFLKNEGLRKKTGLLSGKFIQKRKGASKKVTDYVQEKKILKGATAVD